MNYGKRGIRRKQRTINSKSTKFKKMIGVTLLKALLIAGISCIVLVTALVIGMFRGILDSTPDVSITDLIPQDYASVVYDNEGHEMTKLVAEGSNRSYIEMELIPDNLAHAFVAIEDERFYTHNGIDIKGIMRAAVSFIRNGFHATSGASTITQQLLKNNVFDNWVSEKTFIEKLKRKVQEQYLAIQLEKEWEKDDILEAYMNTINLGHGTLGVQVASLRYFNKPVYELTLSECAVIAGITQNPSYYDPIIYPEHNADKRTMVLDNMLEQEFITQAEHDEALADDVYSRIQTVNATIESTSSFTYFEDALVEQLLADLQDKAGYSPQQASNLLYSGGLSIFSTQDSAIQSIVDDVFADESNYSDTIWYQLEYALTVELADGTTQNYSNQNFKAYFKETNSKFNSLYSSEEDAYAAVEEYKAHIMSPNDTFISESINITPQPQASITVEDQSTGYVVAMVGGRGRKEGSRTLNRAYSTTRQPGSTFKVVSTYAPALDTDAVTLATVLNDAPFNYNDGSPVTNWYNEGYRGICSVRQGIMQSLNIIAVKTLTIITPQLGFDYLENFGFSTMVARRETNDGRVLSDIMQPLALGGLTDGVTNYELNASYATIANNGTYIEPVLYTKVLDSSGNVILDNSTQATRQVIKETTAFLLTSAMQDVVTSGTGTMANFSGQAIAGKTGTTSSYKDVWFAGYTPYYTATVWVGVDNNNNLPKDSHNVAKVLWRESMARIHADLPYQSFTMPSGITAVTVCSRSGKLPIEGLCDATLTTEYFETGTEPAETCDVHYSGWVCAVDGLPAADTCPFKIQGVVELTPLEPTVLASGSTIINADGTVTTAATTNTCQHTAEFFATPEADALIQQQWAALTPEQRQTILDSGGSDYFKVDPSEQPDEGGDTSPEVVLPPEQ